MENKRNDFTRKILVTLGLGLITGIAVIVFREWLLANNHRSIWNFINNLLFADISTAENTQAIGIFYIIGQIFLRLLQMVLVPLIFTSIIRAIQNLSDTASLNTLATKAFKNFAMILSIALVLATLVGYSAYTLGWFQLSGLDTIEITQGNINTSNPIMIFVNAFNNNMIGTLSSNANILGVVVLAFILGTLIQILGDSITVLKKLVDEVYTLSMKLLDIVILKFGPFAIYTLLVRTFATYGVNYLQPALVYMIITSITLLLLMFGIFPIIVSLKTGYNPLLFIKKMYKVAAFGFSTSSSAATLPLTQETVIQDLEVDPSIASFVVPLASAINMSGTAIMQVIATLFVASVAGYEVNLVQLASIILLTVVGSISTPAAPGAGAILLFTILSGMGFTNNEALAAYSFILAINRPVEMLVTAVNVVDDGVSALCIDTEIHGKRASEAKVLEAQ